MIPACFPLGPTIFLEPQQVLGDSQLIVVEGLFDAFEPVVELIEKELELVEVDFF